jgi:hypothetical protein
MNHWTSSPPLRRRRPRRPGISALASAVAVGLIASATSAIASAPGVTAGPSTVVSRAEVLTANVPSMSTARRDAVAAQYQQLASAPEFQSPAENSDPLTMRSVLPMDNKLLVADFREAAGRMAVYDYVVDRVTGVETEVATIQARRTSNRDTATVRFPATGHTATMSRPALASCQSCDLASLALGALSIASKCGIVEEIPFVGEICDGIVLVVSIGGGHICQAQNCQPSTPTDGFFARDPNCNYNSCSFNTAVQNGVGTQLLSLGSDIVWTYPGFSDATLDSGGTASEVDDYVFAALNPTENVQGEQVYAWTHVSSEPNWAVCSATIEWSVTARWSDNVLYTTGFNGPEPKPLMTNCRGYAFNIP